MTKKSLCAEIPENLKLSIDRLAAGTGRKKNAVVGAALYHFLQVGSEKQEEIIKQYLNAYKE